VRSRVSTSTSPSAWGRARARLERLCRYLLRPPIALERLELHASGKLRYSLKKPWSDGSVAVLLEPDDLLSRLCAIIPPPRFHMLPYFGVLSSHASRCREVVPTAPAPTADGKQLALFEKESLDDDVRPRRKPWAWLLRHAASLRRIAELEAKVRQLEQDKRRTDRLLYLTRKVVKLGPLSTGARGRPSKARLGLEDAGARPSRYLGTRSPSKAVPGLLPEDGMGASIPTPGGGGERSNGTES